MLKVEGYGPEQADVVIVGEAPGQDEEIAGRPFVGASGQLLRTLLREAGIQPDKVYYTNVCKFRPPGNDITKWVTDKKRTGIENDWEQKDGKYFSNEVGDGLAELLPEIRARRPRVVIGLGNVALWALTGEWGITDWRGSELRIDVGGEQVPFVPTLHPASILRSWDTRAQAAHDLRFRVARRLRGGFDAEPHWQHNIAPSFSEAFNFLNGIEDGQEIAVDVETSRGRIVCVGIATSPTSAMCIPFISEGYGRYWESFIEQDIKALLAKTMARAYITGQNFNYDASYFDDNFDIPFKLDFDTLIAQSVLFPGTPRGLGYLASMYCDWYRYWKDDARDWANLRDFDGLFRYNCLDVCNTFEVAQKQRQSLSQQCLLEQFRDRVAYAANVFAMQQRGVIRDETKTAVLDAEIEEALHARKIVICDSAGRELNPGSPVQVSKWLYDDKGCRKPARRGKDAGGTGDKELEQVIKWHPELEAELNAVLEWRSLSSVRNNFLRAKLDPDGMLRSSFMTTGTETFRLTSSKNNFSRGTNLLNVSEGGGNMPEYRRVIVPPSGCTYFDCDLARADVWIVAGDANDERLLEKLEAEDIHYENAKDVFGVERPTGLQRRLSKTFVHLSNYGGSARTAAIGAGTTVHEADMAQRRWFSAHPAIKDWHKRTEEALKRDRTIRNPYGFRRVFLDRIEGLLPEALAWSPQSTVAIVASKIHQAFDKIAGVCVTLQMYDSVAGYYPTVEEDRILSAMAQAKDIVVPYPDRQLIIPLGLSTSSVSWGHCKDKEAQRSWPR